VVRSINGALRALAFRVAPRGSSVAARPLGDARWGATVAGFAAAVESSGLEVTTVSFLEGGRQGGWRGLYYRLSGSVGEISAGRVAMAPGWVLVAHKR
jgi:hypothetical protein